MDTVKQVGKKTTTHFSSPGDQEKQRGEAAGFSNSSSSTAGMKMLWQPLLSLSCGSGQLLCPCAPTATTFFSTSRNFRQLQEARPAPQQGKDHSLPHFNLGGSGPAGSRALPAPADLSWARAGRRGEWGAAPRPLGPMAAAQKTPEAGVRLPPQPAWPRERRESGAGPPPRPVGALS